MIGPCFFCIISSVEDGAGIDNLEFLKWHNGGGIFHKSASVDPTAFIEIGAIVHSKCVLSADVHIGSGTVIGPAVTIGQSTKIAYVNFFCVIAVSSLIYCLLYHYE